jgi:endo-1,4-beta-D-glucanase Y
MNILKPLALSAIILLATSPSIVGADNYDEQADTYYLSPDNYLATGKIKIGEAELSVWEEPLSVIIPNERKRWAMAMAHAEQLFRNVSRVNDVYVGANHYLATALKESRLGADPASNTFTYPKTAPNPITYQPHAYNDGFMQIEEGTAFAEMKIMYPNRFGQQNYVEIVTGDRFATSAITAAYYNLFTHFFLIGSGYETADFFSKAKDPQAREKVIAFAYNQGVFSQYLTNLFTTNRTYCLSVNNIADDVGQCLPNNVGSYYLRYVPEFSQALIDATSTDSGIYEARIAVNDIDEYLDRIAILYSQADMNAARQAAHSIFDQLKADDNTISFRNQFGQILDAIMLKLPVDTPENQLCQVYAKCEKDTFLTILTIEAPTGGGKLIIMAKPSKGWEFKEWAGDCKGNNNKPAKTVVKMNKDKRCATVFEPEQFFAEAANPELLPATVKKTSDWETGFCADVIVNNNTDHTVDWVTKFEPGGTINNLWSASYKLLPNGKIRAEGLDWNNEVASGQSVTFGYCADKDGDSELCVGYADIQPAKRSFPQHVSYAANTIHPTNFTQDQQDQHVRDFYDYWKSSYLLSAGTDTNGKSLCRVAFGKSGSNQDITVSEGQGYGMMITALMAGHDPNAQSLFNSLWYFSRKYPSGIDERLMSWKIENGEIVEGNDSAFDGDVDIAYGLLLADAQWGSSGEVNYRNEATTVIQGILESTIGPDSRLPMLGDWVQANGSPYNQYTPRSSDFMPAHFRSFGRATNNPVWDTVIANSQAVIDTIQANYSTDLLPDFIINCNDVNQCVPANSGFLEGAHDGHYYYNAGRDPWRIGLDALLNDDAKSRDQVQKMVTWLANDSGGNANGIKAGYELNGTPIGSYFTTFFAAPFGVATMLDSNQQAFLNDIYAHVYNKQEDYYEDSVNLLSLLVMSGNLWEPVALQTSSLTIEAPAGSGKLIIMAKPSKGWEFKEWAGDCKGNNKKPAKTVAKMNKDQYCTAVFEPK